MRTFNEAWRKAIAFKRCSFCPEKSVEYYKLKYYCTKHYEEMIGKGNINVKKTT